MSCGCEKGTGCVKDILKEIANAQKDIYTECCATSAEQSINDLLGNWGGSTGFDTVPFIIYTENGIPFRGLGVVPGATPGTLGPLAASYYFRVKTVYEDDCAVLELLRDPADLNLTPDNIDVQAVANLTATGLCFTVDLHCFCHITTLPAISAFNGTTGTPGAPTI
ncbi:spore coat protein Z [Terribacillus halophilus]|uniref:Spore coat protein Z n=1 Tax=Terribacillus halophilus TaxID=361279 RepID=A0A1G6PHC2_9BACI|nr:CotY/CotZ family spore coat protein [Terribacillus halophilus]SDC79652.1 spore coat protein Z [Terribacillus halophilus]